jgi:hypothetical protein
MAFIESALPVIRNATIQQHFIGVSLFSTLTSPGDRSWLIRGKAFLECLECLLRPLCVFDDDDDDIAETWAVRILLTPLVMPQGVNNSCL